MGSSLQGRNWAHAKKDGAVKKTKNKMAAYNEKMASIDKMA